MGERSANAQEMPQKSTLSLQITQSEGQRTSLFSFSFAAVSNVFRPNSRRSRTGLSRKRVFVEDPPWLFSFTSTDNLGESDAKLGFKELERKKYNALRRRQVKMETEAWEKRAEEYRELVREMCENNLAPNLPYVKFLFLGWFEPLIEAIDKEQRLQELKRQKASYAPYIGLLPADKGSVRVVQAAVYVGDAIEQEARHMVIPHMPMLVPPRNWKGYGKGGHLFLPSYVMRTHGARQQQDAIRKALDTLGKTKWRVNKKVLSVIESLWVNGGNIAGLVDHEDVFVPEKPLSEDLLEIQKWKQSSRKVKKCNHERHAQRCDIELKLSVAQQMKVEDGFYYPHNLDFRGRAYPMHSHLNNLSSDLCRGVLEFAEGRPLGKAGLHWSKMHLANLYAGGVEKLYYDMRLTFVENHLDDIFDSAERPIEGKRWWLKAEDPFQCLAACMNLSEALKSSSPHAVNSHLPIHQVILHMKP